MAFIFQSVAGAPPPSVEAERVRTAHRALRADGSYQFSFPWKVEPAQEAPAWLKALARWIGAVTDWIGPGWSWLFWIAVAVAVALIAAALLPGVREWLRELAGRQGAEAAPEWRPEEGHARALLQDADRLAAEGRYDEAVHLVLERSIEDIARWRGDLVRPSLTSRDIARAEALPADARAVFSRIVASVERSLFGGRSLDVEDWFRARSDYARFALAEHGRAEG